MKKLEGKVAVVTGAGQGIGRGIALAFSKEGAKLSLPGRTLSKVKSLRKEIEVLGCEALAIRCDVGNKADVIRAVSETVKKFDTIDILVNNTQTFVPAHSLINSGIKDAIRAGHRVGRML